ncbi:MAG: hypothetical protein PVI54_15720, partial [Desulfobacteraceae bacterium]
MFKSILKSALIGAAALMIAAPAHALTEVHLFGASAQFKFWTDAAPLFLDSVCDGDVTHANTEDAVDDGTLIGDEPVSTRDTGIVRGLDCQGTGEEVVISYTTFASIRGIQALKGTAFDGCSAGVALPDWQDLDGDSLGVTFAAFPGTPGTVDDLACQQVQIGASDVAGETFGQESHGQLKGPNSGGYVDFYALAEDTSGLLNCQPIVVPFAFFGHDNLPLPTLASGQMNLTRLQA